MSIPKEKEDVQKYGKTRGIKLLSHTVKLWERIMNAMMRQECLEVSLDSCLGREQQTQFSY